MRTWHAQWTLSRPGHDVERGSHTITAAETEDAAIAATYAHLASIGIGDGERLPSGLNLSVLPVGANSATKPMFELVQCWALLPVLALSEGLCRGLLMAVGLIIILLGVVVFIRNGGCEVIDEETSEWLNSRGSWLKDNDVTSYSEAPIAEHPHYEELKMVYGIGEEEKP